MRLQWLRSTLRAHCRNAVGCAVAGVLLCTACKPQFGGSQDVEKALEKGLMYRSRHLYAKSEETFLEVLRRYPKEARAHKELGYLYFEDRADYVSALFHFERYLELSPASPTNDLRTDVLDEVRAICKQEIAKEVSLSVLTTALQDEIESLKTSNRVMRSQVENLNQRLAQGDTQAPERQKDPGAQTSVNRERNVGNEPALTESSTSTPTLRQTPQPSVAAAAPLAQVRARTHTIQKGDTFFSLAKRYGVPLSRLRQANPRVELNNLQIGQQINIPEP